MHKKGKTGLIIAAIIVAFMGVVWGVSMLTQKYETNTYQIGQEFNHISARREQPILFLRLRKTE